MTRRDALGFSPPSEPIEYVRVYGPGPEGRTCKTCRHLYYRQFSKRYYKCAYREETGGPGSDHRVGWNACAKYEEAS